MFKNKKLLLTLTLLLVLPLSLIFSACDRDKNTNSNLPSTAYEKVKFAFNGVESSLNGSNDTNNVASACGKFVAHAQDLSVSAFSSTTTEDALSLIFAEYSVDDEPTNNIEGLDYNEPPMTQFQCLKYALEKIGENYQFGTKYFYSITGEIYININNGVNMSNNPSEEYKYNYTFTLAIEIDIDENDLIEAKVSFNINLSKGEQQYNTQWYSYLNLNYDMKNTSPNYKLFVLTENKEADLLYLNRIQGYEYDYVEVINNQINEWRKFDLDTNESLVVDDEHQTFNSYTEKDNFKYSVGNCKWYKDGTMHKFTNMDKPEGAETKFKVAKALYEGLKMNTTDINASEFINKQGVENNTINTIYNDFSTVYGKDFIYELISQDSKEENPAEITTGISVRKNDGTAWNELTLFNDSNLRELLTSDEPWDLDFINNSRPYIFYVNTFDEPVTRLESQDISNFTYKITIGNLTKDISLNQNLSDVIVYEFGGLTLLEENYFKITITITQKTQSNLSATFSFYIDFTNIIEEKLSKIFPEELLEMGVPRYDTEDGSYQLTENEKEDITYCLSVNSNSDEFAEYKNKLISNGFIKDEFNKYVKLIDNNVLKLMLELSGDTVQIYVQVEENNNKYLLTWPTDTINTMLEDKFSNFPAPVAEQMLLNVNIENKYVYIFGLTDEERSAYLAQFTELANVIYSNANMVKFVYNYNIYTIDFNNDSTFGFLFLQLDLSRNGSQEAYTITVNDSDPQIFEYLSETTDNCSITLNLNENDTFKLSHHYVVSDCFEKDDETNTYTVLETGNYTFTYRDGRLDVSKN